MTLEAQLAALTEQIGTLIAEVSTLRAASLNSTPNLRLSYTLPEAAEATGAGVWALRDAIRRGELYAKRTGPNADGAYLIPADALRAWLAGTPYPDIAPHAGVRQRKAIGQR